MTKYKEALKKIANTLDEATKKIFLARIEKAKNHKSLEKIEEELIAKSSKSLAERLKK